MAIPLTWQNLFVLVGLAVLILASFAGATGTIMQWQLSSIDNRLNERLTIYHQDQENLQHDLDRVERRLESLEHKP